MQLHVHPTLTLLIVIAIKQGQTHIRQLHGRHITFTLCTGIYHICSLILLKQPSESSLLQTYCLHLKCKCVIVSVTFLYTKLQLFTSWWTSTSCLSRCFACVNHIFISNEAISMRKHHVHGTWHVWKDSDVSCLNRDSNQRTESLKSRMLITVYWIKIILIWKYITLSRAQLTHSSN